MATIYAPYVIERSSRGERTYDVFSRLLMDRIVFLGTPVTDDVANVIIAQLLFLEADNSERDIDDRVAAQAAERGADVGQLYAALEKSGRLKDLERTITEDKVFQWLLDQNDVVNAA